MGKVSPDGNVYQGGTLSGNPVAMAAGIATLTECIKDGFYSSLEKKTYSFTARLNAFAGENNFPFRAVAIGSVFWFAFSGKEKIRRADEIDPAGMNTFNRMYHDLLEHGIYFGPSGYEVGFISAAHSDAVLDDAAEKICGAMRKAFSSEKIKMG